MILAGTRYLGSTLMVNLSTELLVFIGSDLEKDVWLSVETTVCHRIFGTATYSSHLGPSHCMERSAVSPGYDLGRNEIPRINDHG